MRLWRRTRLREPLLEALCVSGVGGEVERSAVLLACSWWPDTSAFGGISAQCICRRDPSQSVFNGPSTNCLGSNGYLLLHCSFGVMVNYWIKSIFLCTCPGGACNARALGIHACARTLTPRVLGVAFQWSRYWCQRHITRPCKPLRWTRNKLLAHAGGVMRAE